MNTLPSEAVKEFQEIYKAQYGIDLTYEQAQRLALKFLKLIQAVYKPIPLSQKESFKQQRNDYEKT